MRGRWKRDLKRRALCVVIVGLQLILLAGVARADEPPPPPNGWGVVSAGGSIDASNGSYRLHGTAGQPSPVGLVENDQYVLGHGYWAPSQYLRVYLPLVLRNS